MKNSILARFALVLSFIAFIVAINQCEPKQETPTPKKEYVSYRVGYINTYVDGVDVRIVNLWDDKTSRTSIITRCIKGQEVHVLEQQDSYVLLKTKDGLQGWCLIDFVTIK